MTDARFEDAADRPLRLAAESVEDLAVISALIQDSVGLARDFVWMRRKRRFALFLNRFRWEDRIRAERAGRPYERVRSVALIENVLAVRASGLDPRDPDLALSLLQISFAPSADPEDPSGLLRLVLSGDGELEIEVEALEIRLEDVTRPYVAPSGKAPAHPED